MHQYCRLTAALMECVWAEGSVVISQCGEWLRGTSDPVATSSAIGYSILVTIVANILDQFAVDVA